MSHSSEEFTLMDTHQWNQDEDYSGGRMSLKSQQHQPVLVLNDNHPQESYQSSSHLQQQQAPVMVTSSQGYPPKDDSSSLNHQSFDSLQKSEQDYVSNSQRIFHPKQQQQPSIGATSLEGFPQKDEDCYQPQQLLPSVGTYPEQSCLSFYQPQKWQTSITVPPTRHPSKDVHPRGYQSSHSPIPMTAPSYTSCAQSPSVKAPSAQNPSKDPNPVYLNPPSRDPEEHGKAYHEKTAVPKAEMTPANADSTETSPKNVRVRRTTTPSPPPICSCCCIS